MSNPSIPIEQECSQTPSFSAFHLPVATVEPYQAGYQQALVDFAITDLLSCLRAYSDANFDADWVALNNQETEALAAHLIQTLIANLDDKLLAAYLNAMCGSRINLSQAFSTLQFSQPSTDLPTSFPDVEMPRFLYGDCVRWISRGESTDWGKVIGRFYSFAFYCRRWRWCYLIWLDPDSPSSAWVRVDIAWEDDLEALAPEAA